MKKLDSRSIAKMIAVIFIVGICILVGALALHKSGIKIRSIIVSMNSEENNIENEHLKGVYKLGGSEDIDAMMEESYDTDTKDFSFYLDLKDVKVGQLLEMLFKMKNKAINYDKEFLNEVRITLISEVPLPIDSIIGAVAQNLVTRGIKLVENTDNVISIVSQGSESGELADVTKNDGIIVTKIIPFKYTVSEMSNVLASPLIPSSMSIKYIEKVKTKSENNKEDFKITSSIGEPINLAIVTDYAENVKRVEFLIILIDRGGPSFSVDKYFVRHMEPMKLKSITDSCCKDLTSDFIAVANNEKGYITVMGRQNIVSEYLMTLSELDTVEMLEVAEYKRNLSQPFVRKIINASTKNIIYALRERANSIEPYDPRLAKSLREVHACEDSSVIMYTSSDSEHVATIESIIDSLEGKRQIYIDMLVVSIDDSKMSSLGVDWSVQKPNDVNSQNSSYFASLLGNITKEASPIESTGMAISEGFGVGMIGRLLSIKGSPVAVMSAVAGALASDSTTKIISQPFLGSVEGEEAKIFVGKTIPVITGTQNVQSTQTSTTTNIETINIGTSISFIATINDDDMINIKMRQEITQESEGVESLSSNGVNYNYPTLSKLKYESTLLIPDKSIMVLGGLTIEGSSVKTKGIPCNSSLCGIARSILRATAGSKTENKYNQNIIMFIKPTIVRDELDIIKANKDKYRRVFSSGNKEIPDSVKASKFWKYIDSL